MRFFAHDGTTTHGPAGIEELLKIPGFDGDTLVCPVGSSDSADWKPALAYAQFKEALLRAPAPAAAPSSSASLPPMPVLPPAASPAMPVPAAFPLPLPEAAAPAPAPAPAPTPKTIPCPSCAHQNLEEAKFCNACGARMDGKLPEPAPAPKPEPAPLFPAEPAPLFAPEPAASLPPEPEAKPAPDPFAHLDPMATFPVDEPAPMPFSEPRRPLQPGKMGQLSAFESEAPSPVPEPAPALAPEPAAEAKAVPAWKRPAVAGSFAAAALVVAGAAYFVLFSKPALPPDPVAELNPSAAPMPAPAPAPETAAAPPASVTFNTAPPPPPPPIRPAKKKSKKMKTPKLAPSSDFASLPGGSFSPKPKRSRKPRPAPVPEPEVAQDGGGETMIESRAPEDKPAPSQKKKGKKAAGGEDPLLESLLADATQPSAKAAPEEAAANPEPAAKPEEPAAPQIGQRPSSRRPGGFSLPGLERPVTSSDRAPASGAPEDAAPQPLAEPGRAAPPPGIEDEPAKPAGSDDLALVQVHEQFDFCAQLLAQGAYGDHYDTCLCKDARDAAPYRGRRGFYVSAKKKEASGGHLETSAKITSSKLEGGTALVKARWKSGGGDKGRESTQTWRLEDGLWCQAP